MNSRTPRPVVTIDQLHLRVPGLSKQQGIQLGKQIARGLSEHWPSAVGPISMDNLDIRLHFGSTTDTKVLARQVVTAIIAQASRWGGGSS